MPTKNAPKSTVTKTRERVQLPSSISSTTTDTDGDLVWPGQSRGSSNSSLRSQLIEDVKEMGQIGAFRRYDNVGNSREQDAFLTLFRSVVQSVYPNRFTAQAVKEDTGSVWVKMAPRVTRPRKAK